MNNITNNQSVVVSPIKYHKNNERKTMDNRYIELKNMITAFYKIVHYKARYIIRHNKKEYQKLLKNIENSLIDNILLNQIIKQNTPSFLGDVLGDIFNTKLTIHIKNLNRIDYKRLIKDRNFMIFYRNLYICKELIPIVNNENFHIPLNSIFDIKSAILAYYLTVEKNISETKILNVLSYFFKDSIIYLNQQDMTEENIEKIRLITTGVKYEKEYKHIANNVISKQKKESHKFDLIQYLSSRIKIKYVSGLNNKHQSHKRPKEHIRSGHYRTYSRTGKIIWIEESIINKGINNTDNSRSAS